MVLILQPEEIDGLISMKEAIELVREGFRQWAQYPDLSDVRRRTQRTDRRYRSCEAKQRVQHKSVEKISQN